MNTVPARRMPATTETAPANSKAACDRKGVRQGTPPPLKEADCEDAEQGPAQAPAHRVRRRRADFACNAQLPARHGALFGHVDFCRQGFDQAKDRID